MSDYRAPRRVVPFVLLDDGEHYRQVAGSDEVSEELVSGILDRTANFCAVLPVFC